MGVIRVRFELTPGHEKTGQFRPMSLKELSRFGEPRKLPKPPRFVPQDDATADRPPTWHYAGWMVTK